MISKLCQEFVQNMAEASKECRNTYFTNCILFFPILMMCARTKSCKKTHQGSDSQHDIPCPPA